MSNTAENLAAVERELAADVAMAEGRADAEDATLPEPAADFTYLDYAATAPLCAEAASAMAPVSSRARNFFFFMFFPP